ncbi:3'-5' exonuclease [Xenorhabdus nematophila]|uniref:3'-5' exonuclease n=1 Tax=Xenorhabdus nematophila TaxID=628 RepID=UPI0032B73037
MNDEELELARADAIKDDRCFSKGRLRDEFRMKPKPGVEPVSFYKNGYGRQFGVFRIADCEPMKSRACSPASEKQIRAQLILSIKARMRSNLAKASVVAETWVNLEPVILDTETTGLGERDQVIELAVTDIWGDVLLNTRLRPTVKISPHAMDVHGISEADLTNEPMWPQIAPALAQLLSGRHVVIFNSSFDSRLLRQTAGAFGDHMPWWEEKNLLCAMTLASDAFGSTNRHGTISLADATYQAGVVWKGRAHSAATDAIATADLVTEIAKVQRNLVVQLQELQSKGNLE